MGFTGAIAGRRQGFLKLTKKYTNVCVCVSEQNRECRVMRMLFGIRGQIVGLKQSLVAAEVQSSVRVHQ